MASLHFYNLCSVSVIPVSQHTAFMTILVVYYVVLKNVSHFKAKITASANFLKYLIFHSE